MLNGRNVFVEKAQERKPGDSASGAASASRWIRWARRWTWRSAWTRWSASGGFGGGPGGGFRGPRYPVASAQVDKEEGRRRAARPEKRDAKKKPGEGRPTPEDRERGKWRWDGNDDY